MVYRADVSNEANKYKNFYFSLTGKDFRERCNDHEWDVKHIKYQSNTESTNWNLKNNNIK